jgi:hypothetical protein
LKGVISFPIPETSNVQRMPEEWHIKVD